MNIYDIDGINELSVEDKYIKTFYKEFEDGNLSRIEVGCDGEAKDDGKERVYLAFELRDLCGTAKYKANRSKDCGEDKQERSGVAIASCDARELARFIEALEFALGVLRQG